MAKRKQKQLPATTDTSSVSVLPTPVPHRGFEAAGVAMVIVAVALCFALFSFDPGAGDNLVGPVGDRLARVLLGGIGVVGYVVGLGLVGIAGATLFGRVRVPSALSVTSALGITLGATVLAHLVAGDSDVLSHPAGGVVGVVLGELMASVVGPVGAALVAIGATLLGVIGISDLSLSRALRDAGGAARFVAMHTFGRLGAWREASIAARKREAELVEAARSARALEKIDRDARERELVASLEEKKRIAVLKATAKAEERALARIAREEVNERVERDAVDGDEDEAWYSSEPEVIEPEIVELDIPGPAAEPEVIIDSEIADSSEDDSDIEDAVEVIERYDMTSQVEADDEEDPFEPDDVVMSEPPEEDDDTNEITTGAIEAQVDLEGDTVPSEGPQIHERIKSEAKFDEDAAQVSLPLEPEKPVFQLPPINLLDYEGDAPDEIDQTELRARATRLEQKLETYGVKGKVAAIRPGPVVTTYEYQPAPGVKVSKIANLSDDIAMSMEAVRVRIVAPIPGRGVVGIELPNDKRENVYLKEIVAHDRFKKSKSLLTLALGKDAEGDAQVRDLAKMPHLLIAGTTGSGKSVSINTMILSILYKATPDQVKFIMVDPKMLELSLYQDIPHLLLPVVTDPRKASRALQWAVDEMERRYQLLSELKVRDIDTFNKRLEKLHTARAKAAEAARLGETEEVPEVSMVPTREKGKIHDPWPGQDLPEKLPYIVVLIDEFADLMCVAPRDVESSVQRLAQKARAAGIHVLLATQRPSTDVITGVIKNNFPSRLAFRVASRHDSATILNNPGAENLLGMGDSLMLGVNSPSPMRIHGGFVSEDEVERVVDFWKGQAKPKYDPTILAKKDDEDGEGVDMEDADEHYDAAVKIVTDTQKASISALQRKLRVGYNRAARMVEMMELQGVVGPAMGPKGEREVLVKPIGPDGPPRS
ncbi:MAG: DNA translocase FtsK 4TM domain-containing protein [Deltaproteobacteria bacterium]|jgi:S-DNA-T family DNA segregation ATPase FtsK/SpoIIIE